MWTSKMLAGLLVCWVLILMYMNIIMISNTLEQQLEEQLSRIKPQLYKERQLHLELTQLVAELQEIHTRSNIYNITTYMIGRNGCPISTTPSMTRELLGRKISSDVEEMWNYLHSTLNKITLYSDDKENPNSNIVDFYLKNLLQSKRTLVSSVEDMRGADNLNEWRERESRDLADLVQRRIHYVQNPRNCTAAKKILCKLDKRCSYSCQLHHAVNCLIVAYATQFTVVLENHNWQTEFQLLSDSCPQLTKYRNNIVLSLDIPTLQYESKINPLAIPEDLAPRLIRLHGDPAIWWIGQFMRYIVRPLPALENEIHAIQRQIGFVNPIVGVHIRQHNSMEEYMFHVGEYYEQLRVSQGNPVMVKRVYLASDDPKIFEEAAKRYSDYDFIFGLEYSKSDRQFHKGSALHWVALDIHFLSLCDYLVCRFSSAVCYTAYELMQTYHGDASRNFYSLDNLHYIEGQDTYYVRAIQQHEAQHEGEISFEAEDLISILGNNWNGYSRGSVHGSEVGLFPLYKTINHVEVVKFPEYPEVPLTTTG